MLFNSLAFAIFLPIVFILYWFVANNNLKFQNILLLFASYLFYAYWDWRFLFLLAFISLLNYTIGLLIQKSELIKRRKFWLIFGVIANIGVLSYFKYSSFFIESFLHLFSLIGFTLQKPTLNLILPLGISFYIFLSLSYIIDIYQNKLKACRNIFDVLLTLSFFPIILAGPIQRPISLLPQIQKKRIFNYTMTIDGLRQILWGLFMKIVIADNCALYTNEIFQNFSHYSGSTLLLGALFYSIQIYADFAGYSEIALGVSKLFGINLMQNFAYPYFAKNITEFWRRWHISLTSWFRDYVFLPIAYSVSRNIKSDKVLFIDTDLIIYIVGISITWLLTGLWHGGSYNFIVWGFIHGFSLIVYQSLKKPRKNFFKKFKISNNNLFLISFEWFLTIGIIVIAWIFFRTNNLKQAFDYISVIFSSSLFQKPNFVGIESVLLTILAILIFVFFEWIGRDQQHTLAKLNERWRTSVIWVVYYFIILLIMFLGVFKQSQFIYFQF